MTKLSGIRTDWVSCASLLAKYQTPSHNLQPSAKYAESRDSTRLNHKRAQVDVKTSASYQAETRTQQDVDACDFVCKRVSCFRLQKGDMPWNGEVV